ncbi:uncharacterized protein LOC130901068 [Diorhabda carinulata]|uniref:uncharacterized protein LOC130901068 n=1 Tax=Diorhabda carinulata TaxID=1163345 RepID=UPI0025A00581|nr:uncharacterized protein LOC130901068 [Diorhabda carinulata]
MESDAKEKEEIDKKELYFQVFQNIAYVIHKCPALKELFLNWCKLTPKEKKNLNYLSRYVLEPEQFDLYAPIIGGLKYWSDVQDTQGACGFSESPLDFELNAAVEKRICQTIIIIDEMIANMLLRPMLCKDIQKFHSDNADFTGQGEG